MALTHSVMTALGSPCPEFALPDVRGTVVSRDQLFRNMRAGVIIVMCNHCPYVQAQVGKYVSLAKEYAQQDIVFIGINPNDASRYPDDSLEGMQTFIDTHHIEFPYLRDETQEVARSLGAVCTPDIFVYRIADTGHELVYRGRCDDNWQEPDKVTAEDLRNALDAILRGELPDAHQMPSMGCSIKWLA